MKRTIALSLTVLGALCMHAQKKDTVKTVSKDIETVELFGQKNRQPEQLEIITRLPLKIRDQIQSISTISYKVIEELGGLTVTDVVKNIPGVTQFATYGGAGESMTIRGFRGVPVLKNGVMMDTDFRTASMITDMQGVESIQVIKGSAAVTQGIGNGLGSAGGVINVVTKTPRFLNRGSVDFRAGSWDLYRGTVDFEGVLDAQNKVAVRFDGAYQSNKSFRNKKMDNDRIYINPSVSYRPDNKTEFVAEFEYMNDENTPDRGTINLGSQHDNALYAMPKGKFLGFFSDNRKTETYTFTTTATRKINDKLKFRMAYINMNYNQSTEGSSPSGVDATMKTRDDYANRYRFLNKSGIEQVNQVFQFDFIGQDVKTGPIKHTFQIGGDWKQENIDRLSYETVGYNPNNFYEQPNRRSGRMEKVFFVDRINVLNDIPNILPNDFSFTPSKTTNENKSTFGLMAQDVITINKYLKAHLGIRYSRINGVKDKNVSRDAWDPSFGLMVSPVENINIFGSYTTTTSTRSSDRKLQDGSFVGNSVTKQFEAGFKSDWFNETFRFNATYFNAQQNNLLNQAYDDTGKPFNPAYYIMAGDLVRQGVEVEAIGRILPSLQIMAGWAYTDAQYHDSPTYVEGSAPMNTPKHTANAWLNYKFNHGALDGLDIGAGIYYVGKRPVNEFSKVWDGHAFSEPNVLPFLMNDYTTVDAQIGYMYKKQIGIRVFFNNIFDAVGYSSYFRGGFIDQINPRNVSVQIKYNF